MLAGGALSLLPLAGCPSGSRGHAGAPPPSPGPLGATESEPQPSSAATLHEAFARVIARWEAVVRSEEPDLAELRELRGQLEEVAGLARRTQALELAEEVRARSASEEFREARARAAELAFARAHEELARARAAERLDEAEAILDGLPAEVHEEEQLREEIGELRRQLRARRTLNQDVAAFLNRRPPPTGVEGFREALALREGAAPGEGGVYAPAYERLCAWFSTQRGLSAAMLRGCLAGTGEAGFTLREAREWLRLVEGGAGGFVERRRAEGAAGAARRLPLGKSVAGVRFDRHVFVPLEELGSARVVRLEAGGELLLGAVVLHDAESGLAVARVSELFSCGQDPERVAVLPLRGRELDLTRHRTHEPDARLKSVGRSLERDLSRDPEQFVERLVTALTAGIRDEFRRVKVLHDWVATRIEYDHELSAQSERTGGDDWILALRRGKTICAGYSALFEQLCKRAGIPCVVVTGRSKGSDDGHAWNAVQVGDRWHLVDTTWDAGGSDAKRSRSGFGHAYFLAEPARFLYSHFPDAPEWQLVEEPITEEEFRRRPFLRPAFFEHGLELVTPLERVTRVETGSLCFDLRVPPDVVLRTVLMDSEGTQEELRTFEQYLGDGLCRVQVVFPRPGAWTIDLYCGRLGANRTHNAVSLEARAEVSSTRLLPVSSLGYARRRACLHEPLRTPLPRGSRQTFRISVPGARAVYLFQRDELKKLAPVRGEPDTFELETVVAQDPKLIVGSVVLVEFPAHDP